MGLQEDFFQRTNLQHSLEKNRVLSDNFRITLLPISNFSTPDTTIYPDFKTKGIQLTEFSFTEFSWEARDEITVWKPAGNLMENCRVERLGFNIEMKWSKNSCDLMQFMFDHHVKYYGGNTSVPFNANDRTAVDAERIWRSTFLTQKDDAQACETPSNEGQSIFDSYVLRHDLRSIYLSPRFDLLISIRHYNGADEDYVFRSVRFFKPSQRVSQNSSEIEETCMAFSPLAFKKSVPTNKFHNIVGSMLEYMLRKSPDGSTDFSDRFIINTPAYKPSPVSKNEDRT